MRLSARSRAVIAFALVAIAGTVVLGQLTPAATPTTGVPASSARDGDSWRSDLEDVPLGTAGCRSSSGTVTADALDKQWDYWDQCGAEVVSVAAEGLPPTPWQGDRVVKWHKPAGDGGVYQKLNRTMTSDNWPSGKGGGSSVTTRSPKDVSARYIVYQYIPSARFHLNPGHGWVILNGFKENYLDPGGNWHQDPIWVVGCNNFSSPAGISCMLSPHTSPAFSFSDIADRWTKWEYRLYQGDRDTTGHGGRIELYMDDKLVDVGYNSEKHVGSAAFVPLDRSLGWVWITGQYTSNQTTNGIPDYQNTDVTSYVGLSTVLPLP